VSSAGGPKRRACGRPVPNALEKYYLPGQSNRASASSSSNNRRYHESLDNLTPADVYLDSCLARPVNRGGDGSVGFLWVCRNRVRVRTPTSAVLYAATRRYFSAGSDMDGFDQRRRQCPTGAGIIADSDPAFEQGEYINKAKALFDVADESQTLRQRRWARAIAI